MFLFRNKKDSKLISHLIYAYMIAVSNKETSIFAQLPFMDALTTRFVFLNDSDSILFNMLIICFGCIYTIGNFRQIGGCFSGTLDCLKTIPAFCAWRKRTWGTMYKFRYFILSNICYVSPRLYVMYLPGEGGGVLSFFLHIEARAQHLLFTKKKCQEFQSPPKNIWNLATQKNIPHSVP